MSTIYTTIAVLQSVVVGQVCEPYPPIYYSPPIYYTSPSVVRIEAPIYTNILYGGTVYRKEYVDAVLPSGKKMKVPVINGIMPSIDTRCVNGAEVLDFTYDNRDEWSGKSPICYTNLKKEVAKKPAPKVSDYEYNGRKIGIHESSDRPPVITESRTPAPKVGESVLPGPVNDEPILPKKVPAPSFQDELKAIQAKQKLKDDEYAATIKRLEDNIARLQSTIQKMEQISPKAIPIDPPTPRVLPDDKQKAIVPGPVPGMKKPSEITPKGT